MIKKIAAIVFVLSLVTFASLIIRELQSHQKASETPVTAAAKLPVNINLKPLPHIISTRERLEKDVRDGYVGNIDGDVTIVLFHDYNCGYCTLAAAMLLKLLKEDRNICLVIKDYPILGKLSEQKAAISVAVAKLQPDKWYYFYHAMETTPVKTPARAMDLAERWAGVETQRIINEYKTGYTTSKINENRELARELNITSTPAYIINGKIVKISKYDELKKAVADARAASSGAPQLPEL